MKFKVRPGFTLFKDHGDAWAYHAQGAGSGVVPLAREGQVRQFTIAELQQLARAGALGRIEPVDNDAIAYYGDTAPAVSLKVTRPELFAQPAPEPERPGHDWRGIVHA